MTAQVTLTLSDKVYEGIKQRARERQQEIAQTITDFLEDSFPINELSQSTNGPRSEQLQALDREKEAYIKLHPQLKQSYWGRYVAIYQGKLIDDDVDFATLVERVRSRLPDQVVWISEVEEEPIPTIILRSPRFMRDRV